MRLGHIGNQLRKQQRNVERGLASIERQQAHRLAQVLKQIGDQGQYPEYAELIHHIKVTVVRLARVDVHPNLEDECWRREIGTEPVRRITDTQPRMLEDFVLHDRPDGCAS
jgi:hypothetical protein